MYPFSVPPPPPVAPSANWVPPPPMAAHDPLESPGDWYIDIPSRLVTTVIAKVPELDRRFGTRTTLVQGGHHHWARFLVHGKPIGIHYLVSDIFKVAPGVEVGYSPDSPFHSEPVPPEDPSRNVMPVYHASWTQFSLSKGSKI